MKKLIGKIRTNEDNAAVKLGLAVLITGASIGAGIWATKANKTPQVNLIVVEEAVENLTDAVQ